MTKRELIALLCAVERLEMPREIAADEAFNLGERGLLVYVGTKEEWQLTDQGHAELAREIRVA